MATSKKAKKATNEFKLTFSATKEIRVTPIRAGGQNLITIRQFYATKKEPGVMKPGHKYITVPADEDGLEILRAAAKFIKNEDTEYKDVGGSNDE